MFHLPDLDWNEASCRGDPYTFDWMKRHEELLFCVASGENATHELIPTAHVPSAFILVFSMVRKSCI